MTAETHCQLANFIWSICNLLRGPYKRNEYRKVILPLTVLRRFDCLLAPTKAAVLTEFKALKGESENIISHRLKLVTGHQFYHLSRLDQGRLLDDPNQLPPNLNSYINAFSQTSENEYLNLMEDDLRPRGELQARDARWAALDVVPKEPPVRHANIVGWPALTAVRKGDEAAQMAHALKSFHPEGKTDY